MISVELPEGYSVSAATHGLRSSDAFTFVHPMVAQGLKRKLTVTFDGMTQADYLKKDGIKRRTKQEDYL